MSLLVLNAGSSSLKFALFDEGGQDPTLSGSVEELGTEAPSPFAWRVGSGPETTSEIEGHDHASAVRAILDVLQLDDNASQAKAITAIGHRVVHGGPTLTSSVRIDVDVKARIEQAAELAPLHNPPALAVIQAAERAWPALPQVAVFDTAFFASLPRTELVYPLPYDWFEEWGIRRYGFHGISHQYCAQRAAEFLGRDPRAPRLVICHLGHGCSASAVHGGKPVATTMGFTPLEGLMMGTRSGSVDPGLLTFVQRRHDLDAEALEHALQHKSGLLGVSGVSSDVREVQAQADAGNERCRLALELFARRARAAIGALTVQLGGLDALVFTAGIGEHAPRPRSAICHGLECLGARLDEARNAEEKPDADLATEASAARILVLTTREDTMIARETERLVLSS